ncbi:ComEC/Rec2 family competence protein [Piscinibacter terrae]|uniref:MBL fold metallo-hydrolase n=1 Tax=Piscinibacter terrae TaxID=2496871 RepID=A0A3N7HTU6_9BURK|nr:MBL fold metallo-hydrolase [Albitalea terrae]RQP25748.1 MBL fold metallo-hydrolase [Albitalea terrae]
MTGTLTILDVGHGNCSIVRDGEQVAVVDAGRGPFATKYLEQVGIKAIDLIIISHADEDHLAGIIGLLSSEQFDVKEVALNSDAEKDTKIWRDVRKTLESLHNRGKVKITIGIFRGGSSWSTENIQIRVLAPSLSIALSGPGGTDTDGKRISSNSGSIVLRATHSSGNSALLAADMEELTLEEMLRSGCDLAANVLVFPHHGGLPGKANPEKFSAKILRAVKPTSVIFSNGRDKHDNPKPEVLEEVAKFGASHIACTQISKNCHSKSLKQTAGNLGLSAGADDGKSCAGTIEIDLCTGRVHKKQEEIHVAFVQTLESPMCQKTSNQATLQIPIKVLH